jgi:dihydrodipicolinate synthase/N-acetylneuraminate lyase
MNKLPQLGGDVSALLKKGVVIPAHPLALTSQRKLDERRQRALTRYYLAAGVGGVAVAVHTTQFEIRNPGIDLLKPVLELAAEECDYFTDKKSRAVLKIAGVVGKTEQAQKEARLAADLDYNAVLISLAAFKGKSNSQIIEHCRTVAEIMPLIGFYLQPAVGGRILDVDFWRSFAQIENVVAIKMAPFNRYQTLDVVRAVIESGRAKDIALYTGNDDSIVADLLTEFNFGGDQKKASKRIVGGLLGHWSVWAKKAVELLKRIHDATTDQTADLLREGVMVTDSNAAFFDAANNFKGCIVGLHEVLRKQGLLENLLTLNPSEILTPAQAAEIDRVYKSYPDLNDDLFVQENLDEWLK